MSAWLIDVLEAALPELGSARRDELAAAILAAVPGRLIADTIAKSASDVLHQRGIADEDSLSRELGNNAAMTVIVMLQASVAFDFDTSDVDTGEACHGA